MPDVLRQEFETTKIEDNGQREFIFRWLSAVIPSHNYQAALASRHHATGSWFINGTRFMGWKAEANSFLWIYGNPGCGKTVLSSSIIEVVKCHCDGDASLAFAYFFFDGRDSQSELQRHENFIRSLIWQFSAQCDALPGPLTRLYGRCGSGYWQPSITSLHNTLQLILDGFQHAYVIIDSLDECTERRELLRWIEEITDCRSSKLHLLVTSRNEPDIARSLQPLGYGHVCMERGFMNQDIEKYLDDMFLTDLELNQWDEKVQKDIKGALMESADKGFRLVALQLKELQICQSRATLLKNLPRSFDEMYDLIILKLDNDYREDALKILQWLAFAVRPLSLDELAQVVGVVHDSEFGLCFKPGRVYQDSQLVLTVCSSLVTYSEGKVKLAHISVKEYLLSERRRTAITSFNISETGSHSLISQTCLAYLLQFTNSVAWDDNKIEDYPLALYSSRCWTSHAQLGSGDKSDALHKLTMELLQPQSLPLVTWVKLCDPDYPGQEPSLSKPSTEIASPLYYASLSGLLQAVEALVGTSGDVNASGGRYSKPLQAASSRGHEAIVKLLLEKGADINGGPYGNALQAASSGGHEGTVRLLLKESVDVNAQGGFLGNALQAASYQRHEGIVKLLLGKEVDVNARGGFYGNALQAASYGGHEGITKMLLEKEADVNAVGGLYGNALQAAASCGHEEIVKLLLEKDAIVNTQGGLLGSALQGSSSVGHEGIVKLLLDKGADVNAQCGKYGNALRAASYGGHEAIVKILLDKGAHVNEYGKALQDASSGGQKVTVKLLLEKGADINSGEYSNALHEAASGGHEAIVELLLEEGADVNAQGGDYGNALQAASYASHEPYGSHERTVKLLLEKGADVNAQGGFFGSALQAVLYGGNEVIVDLLLEKGADVNAQGGFYGSPLQAASCLGHEAMVKLLLKKEANVHAQGGEYGNALQAASWAGHETIVQLLLEKGVDINVQGGFFGNALQAASYGGHEGITKMLLEKEVDVNAQGGKYGNALQGRHIMVMRGS